MNKASVRVLSPRLGPAFILAIGIAATFALQILLGMLLAEDAYKLRSLGNEERGLANEAQIIAEEVASLGSPQNLADAAHSLGMVVNSAPVMLDITTDKIFGDADPVSASEALVASANLVPNSALGSTTDFSQAVAAGSLDSEPAEVQLGNESQEELFVGELIPASPTS
ncbi:MAG: hypothetical protein RL198_118 [Actinomycetota bacterium]|jgi:hypothetical protein